MNSSKKYYWIKLKTDFFNQDAIDFLMSQDNGCEYIVLYQMLCLNTANNEGTLSMKIGEMIVPYDVKKIVRDTRYFDTDTVIVALELFKKLGLIYEQEDTTLKIANFDFMIGSESASKEAVKKREYRARKKLENKTEDKKGDKKGTNCPTEIEIEKEIDIELDKELDKERNKDIYINTKTITNTITNNNGLSDSLSVSENEINDFFERYEIEKERDKKKIIQFLNNGMDLEVIEKGLDIPYVKNIKEFDFDIEQGPVKDPISYGITILNNWNDANVKDIYDMNRYNKIHKNKS